MYKGTSASTMLDKSGEDTMHNLRKIAIANLTEPDEEPMNATSILPCRSQNAISESRFRETLENYVAQAALCALLTWLQNCFDTL